MRKLTRARARTGSDHNQANGCESRKKCSLRTARPSRKPTQYPTVSPTWAPAPCSVSSVPHAKIQSCENGVPIIVCVAKWFNCDGDALNGWCVTGFVAVNGSMGHTNLRAGQRVQQKVPVDALADFSMTRMYGVN